MKIAIKTFVCTLYKYYNLMSKNRNINTILFLSILLFSIKWILSFYFYDEALSVRIIFDSGPDGEQYFPLIKYLTSFELNKSYDPYIENLKIIPLPLAGIFVHSIFLKIFGYPSFLIVEFLAIFTFLIIFYKIFSYFFSKNESILLSLLFFTIPAIVTILDLGNLPYFNLMEDNFYSTRVPRPMISSLYLFSFIYLIVSIEKGKFFNKKKFVLLGLILGFTLSSFFHFFFIEITSLLIFLTYKFKLNLLKKIVEQYKNYLLSIFFFLLSSLPFLIILFLHEKGFTSRQGLFNIAFEQKKILFDHYLNGYIKIEFLLFFIISFCLVYISNKRKILNYEIINIFFILFLGATFAPIIFVLFSNKAFNLYHFNNAIFVWAFLFLVIYFITVTKHFIKIRLNVYVYRIFLISITFLYCVNSYLEKRNEYDDQIARNNRIEFQKVAELINDNANVSKTSIMTFNTNFMIWAIIHDVEYLSLINAVFTSKTDDMIENDLIHSFKFLNLDVDDLKFFLRNKKNRKWRYLNENVAGLFFYKYQANSLKTFNDSKNFDPEVAEFIFSSSPFYTQQSAIHNEEFVRFEKKFYKTKLQNFDTPEIIILEKMKPFTKNITIKKQHYCKLYNGDIYNVYLKNNKNVNPNKCS